MSVPKRFKTNIQKQSKKMPHTVLTKNNNIFILNEKMILLSAQKKKKVKEYWLNSNLIKLA